MENLKHMNVGARPNDGLGDTLRDAFIDVNKNSIIIEDAINKLEQHKDDSYTKDEVYTKAETELKIIEKISDYSKEVDQELAKKANKSDVYSKTESNELLDKKADKVLTYTKTEVDELIKNSEDGTSTDIQTKLDLKADKANTYTKKQVDVKFDEVNQELSDLNFDLTSGLDLKADKLTTYTKTQVDTLIDAIDVKIVDAYSKNETDILLDAKANKVDVYSKVEMTPLLDAKANASETYTKAEVYTKTEIEYRENVIVTSMNKKIDEKADRSKVYSKDLTYTKTEVDDLIEQNNSNIPTDVYTKTQVNNLLNDKEDKGTAYPKAQTYTKTQVDDLIANNSGGVTDAYTKAQSDAKFETKVNASNTYELKGTAYTKSQADSKFALKGEGGQGVKVRDNINVTTLSNISIVNDINNYYFNVSSKTNSININSIEDKSESKLFLTNQYINYTPILTINCNISNTNIIYTNGKVLKGNGAYALINRINNNIFIRCINGVDGIDGDYIEDITNDVIFTVDGSKTSLIDGFNSNDYEFSFDVSNLDNQEVYVSNKTTGEEKILTFKDRFNSNIYSYNKGEDVEFKVKISNPNTRIYNFNGKSKSFSSYGKNINMGSAMFFGDGNNFRLDINPNIISNYNKKIINGNRTFSNAKSIEINKILNYNLTLSSKIDCGNTAKYMFSNCIDFNEDISILNTSNVIDMNYMFNNCNVFNQSVEFDTSNVTDMPYMFRDCRKFNKIISLSDTSNVTNMYSMFYGCSEFNQPVNFNTSNVTDMSSMFQSCKLFNQPVEFDTSKVINIGHMFSTCYVFNQPVNFNTSNVTNMYGMFTNCVAFNQPVEFDTSKVKNMQQMFNSCSKFNKTLSFSDTSNVTNMSYMFTNCKEFNQSIDFNTSNVTDISYMFSGCTSFNQDLPSKFNMVEDMRNICRNTKNTVAQMSKMMKDLDATATKKNIKVSELKLNQEAYDIYQQMVADGRVIASDTITLDVTNP